LHKSILKLCEWELTFRSPAKHQETSLRIFFKNPDKKSIVVKKNNQQKKKFHTAGPKRYTTLSANMSAQLIKNIP